MAITVRKTTGAILFAVREATPPTAEELDARARPLRHGGLSQIEATIRLGQHWRPGERKQMSAMATARRLEGLTGVPWAVTVGPGYAAAGPLDEVSGLLGGGQ